MNQIIIMKALMQLHKDAQIQDHKTIRELKEQIQATENLLAALAD